MDSDKSTMLLGNIKAALQMKIAKSGLESVPMESEQKLAARFSVARQTIHKVILDLLKDGWLLRKNKKYTLFTNPDCANPGIKVVGIVRGSLSGFTVTSHSLMSGLFNAFSGSDVHVHFIQSDSASLDEKILELKNAELDGLIVLKGFDTDYPHITEKILKLGIPVIFVYETYCSDQVNLPEDVTSKFDRIGCLKRIAARVKSLKYKRVFMVSSGDDAFQLFNSVSGDMVKKEYFNKDVHLLAEQFASVIQKNPPDLVICDGSALRYRYLFDALKRFPEVTPALMLHKQALAVVPEIGKMYRIHFLDDMDMEFERGVKIAKTLLKKITKSNTSKRKF